MQNYATWEAVAAAADISAPTIWRILREKPHRHVTSLNSRNPVAKVLGFPTWNHLLAGWTRTGKDIPADAPSDVTPVMLPTRVVGLLHAAAARKGMTLEQWLTQLAQQK